MRTAAIICELNPLHRGHKYLFDEVRRSSDCVIAIMSGSFVQRGEPAILDKYTRAEIAVKAGADLVLELPFPWCSASAEFFAAAGTAIAEKTGAESLAFGVGCEDASVLCRAADFFADPDIEAEIREAAENDPAISAALLRERCLKTKLGAEVGDVLRTPNDILAIEYLRQIRIHDYHLNPRMIHRLSSDEDPCFCGATQIRALLREGGASASEKYLPCFVYPYISKAMSNGAYAFPDVLQQIVFQALRAEFSPYDGPVAEGEGGLMERIRTAAYQSTSPAEMLLSAATKRYTNARIRRVMLYYLLRVTPKILREIPTVTTLLAAGERGRAYLSSIRKNPGIHIVTKPADHRLLTPDELRQYRYTLNADMLYTLCLQNPVPADSFLKAHPRFP